MKINRINEDLYDIRLNFKQTNSRNFLSTWVYKDSELCFLVDCGPTSTIESLKKGLTKIGISENDLNFILLTHIHIDHAGGVGNLIEYFPHAKIICNNRGIKHLINPEKLWDGSKKVLGKVADWYGKIKPVSEDKIYNQKKIGNSRIRIVETLGHAPHHQSYLFDNEFLFVGEAAGTHKPLSENFFIRPSTPPIFDYDIWKNSIQKLLAEELTNYKICYPHYGMRDNADLMIRLAEKQLSIWIEVIDQLFNERNQPEFQEQVISELFRRDKNFLRYNHLTEEIREREYKFIHTSLYGILSYLSKKRKINTMEGDLSGLNS